MEDHLRDTEASLRDTEDHLRDTEARLREAEDHLRDTEARLRDPEDHLRAENCLPGPDFMLFTNNYRLVASKNPHPD